MNEILAKFLLNGELTDLNTYINAERGNKFNGAKIKKTETERIVWEVKNQCKHAKVSCEFKLFIRWFVKDKKKDPDNVAFAKKFILDGMVSAGLINTDGMKQVTSFQDEFYVDKEHPRIEVYLL
jgi:Holliday junction resolvase RusA-like endonuclease